MSCRTGCGACCIAPAINTPFYQMPQGKKAGERCVHLSADNLCGLFNLPQRPDFCERFQAEVEFCGDSFVDAMRILSALEGGTAP